MTSYAPHDIVVTGIGVTSAVGHGKAAFGTALLQGRSHFDVMRRPGRQCVQYPGGKSDDAGLSTAYIGAEIEELPLPASIPKTVLRTTSFSVHAALVALHEAWLEATLADVDPLRIGLVVGGSNFQQRELVRTYDTHRDRVRFLRPTYGLSFMDSDLCGACTELFAIQGFAHTLGNASASGQSALIQASQAVRCGQVDVCIALGALMDLSYWECQGFRSMGAMGSDRFAEQPALACRPFDQDRDGFIYGEASGAVVVESAASAAARGVRPYARIPGWSQTLDRNRNPNPSLEGEIRVIATALEQANLSASDIDYVNPHGSGSLVGDETELQALRHSQLLHAHINSTKSITGHCLTAAGLVEIIATLLQMKEGRLHPCLNLENPMDPDLRWVRHEAIRHTIDNALKLSFGFGGINTAVCLQRI